MSKKINEADFDSLTHGTGTINVKELLESNGYSTALSGITIMKYSYFCKLDFSDVDLSNAKISFPSCSLIIIDGNTKLEGATITFSHGNAEEVKKLFAKSGAVFTNTNIKILNTNETFTLNSTSDSISADGEVSLIKFEQCKFVKKYPELLGNSEGICYGFVLEIARLIHSYNNAGISDNEAMNGIYQMLENASSRDVNDSETAYNDFVFMANCFQLSQPLYNKDMIQINEISDKLYNSSSFLALIVGRHAIGVRSFIDDSGDTKYQVIDPNVGFYTLGSESACNNTLSRIISQYNDDHGIRFIDAFEFINYPYNQECSRIPDVESIPLRSCFESYSITTYFLELFLEKGGNAHINKQHYSLCETALMKAATSNNIEIVTLLLKYGADLNIANKHGKTVLDLVRNNEIKEILLNHQNQNFSESKMDPDFAEVDLGSIALQEGSVEVELVGLEHSVDAIN